MRAGSLQSSTKGALTASGSTDRSGSRPGAAESTLASRRAGRIRRSTQRGSRALDLSLIN